MVAGRAPWIGRGRRGVFFCEKKEPSGKLTSISKEKRFLFGKLSIDGGCSSFIKYYLCLFSGVNPPKWELQPQVADDVAGYHEMGGETLVESGWGWLPRLLGMC